ncbi:MAG: hypothetical protein ABID63_18325 [Pseudomonadota bacterium]
MDIWTALQWVMQDQKADRAFAANDDFAQLDPGGSVTASVMDASAMGARIDGGGRMRAADLDPDAELIWTMVDLMARQNRAGAITALILPTVPVQMRRYALRCQPVAAMVACARRGEMPDWIQGGVRNAAGLTRREVEESRLEYLMVWEAMTILCTRLRASPTMGIAIEMPGIARAPWNARKKTA